MICWPRADGEIDEYGLLDDQGITFTTIEEPGADWGIDIPEDAVGEARIRFVGTVRLKVGPTTYIDFPVVREFPVYIEPMDSVVGTTILDSSSPACWIGATHHLPDADDIDHGIPLASRSFPSSASLDPWLIGGDEGPWVKRKKAGETNELVVLFGDVGINWHSTISGGVPFDWFSYRGSGLGFRFSDSDLDGVFMEDPDMEDGYDETSCPRLEPLLHEDDLAWEIVRADGFNSENGRYINSTPPEITDCFESGDETVTAVGGFQFLDQEARGEAYIWFGVVPDWGSRFWLDHRTWKPVDELMKIAMSDYLFNYDYEFNPPWSSFIAKWDYERGVDDLERSASWGGGGATTKFVVNAVVPVDSIESHIPGAFGTGPGILVWHTGRYRMSDIYFSYALKDDVLRPDRYWHFGGYDMSGNVVWEPSEAGAKPVVWDDVGEISALYLADIGMYALIYNVNSFGQYGIVMRVAEDPWGPFGPVIPLFDCGVAVDEWGSLIRHPESRDFRWRRERSRWCHAGFTHESLMTVEPSTHDFTMLFNVSFPEIYKVLLVETSGDLDDFIAVP